MSVNYYCIKNDRKIGYIKQHLTKPLNHLSHWELDLLSHSFCGSGVWAQLRQVLWLRDVREAAFLVLARARVSSEGLIGEGSISTPVWFLVVFSFLQAAGLMRALVPCGMLARGYVQFLAPGASPTQLIASSPQWARESACHRPTSPNPLFVHFSEPCQKGFAFIGMGGIEI